MPRSVFVMLAAVAASVLCVCGGQIVMAKPASAGPVFNVITLNACAVVCDGTGGRPNTFDGRIPRREILNAVAADPGAPRVVALQEFCTQRANDMDATMSQYGFRIRRYIAKNLSSDPGCGGFGNWIFVRNTATTSPQSSLFHLEAPPSSQSTYTTWPANKEYKGAVFADAWVITERFMASSAHTRSGSAGAEQARTLCSYLEAAYGTRQRGLIGDLNTNDDPARCVNDGVPNLATNAAGVHLVTQPPNNRFDYVMMSRSGIAKNAAHTYDSASDHHSVVVQMHFR